MEHFFQKLCNPTVSSLWDSLLSIALIPKIHLLVHYVALACLLYGVLELLKSDHSLLDPWPKLNKNVSFLRISCVSQSAKDKEVKLTLGLL